jgi:hypothetical protein
MSDEKLTADLIPLATAIEKICEARHGPKWRAASKNLLVAERERLAPNKKTKRNWLSTIKKQNAANENVSALRNSIAIDFLQKLGTGQLIAYWLITDESKPLSIAPDHWNVFDLEANRDWPNATRSGKSLTVYLDQSWLELFPEISHRMAPVTRYGRREGETWQISDVCIFEKMATEIDNGEKISVAAKRYAPEAKGAGTEESRATRLRKAYPRWAKHSR